MTPPGPEPRPVIVLGVDGLDHALVEAGMRAGRLPAISELARKGSFGPLLPTTPAESPVSWASLVTGLNPAKTGIFDFVRRIPGTYGVELSTVSRTRVPSPLPPPQLLGAIAALALVACWALRRRGRKRAIPLLCGLVSLASLVAACASARLPRELDSASPARRGEAFWDRLGAAGQRVEVLWAPLEFPPRPSPQGVRLLSGLGTPDILGTQGTYSLLTDQPGKGQADLEMGGRLLPISWRSSSASAILSGPIGTSCELELAREPGGAISVSGPSLSAVVEPGKWSQWVRVLFPVFPGFALSSVSRLHLQEDGGALSLYVSPGGLDPVRPPPGIGLSQPAEFSRNLEQSYGLFSTLGWAADTMAVQDGTLPETAFLESLEATYRSRETMLLGEARKPGWDVLFAVLEEPDRASHVLWRATDPAHPAYDARLAARHGHAIEGVYGWIDGTVRRLLEARPDATLLLVSDHGFASFRWSVNVNRWLLENGYLALKDGAAGSGGRVLSDLYKRRDLWTAVDWHNTRAYSVGLGLIYLNLAGREPFGLVKPGLRARALADEIASRLTALRHPSTGESVVRAVDRADRLYSGGLPPDAPELVVSFAPGFRVSWQSALGNVDEALVLPNRRAWSGDHCSVDPASVRGVLLSSSRLAQATATVLDVAPTILALRGVRPSSESDGSSLETRQAGR